MKDKIITIAQPTTVISLMAMIIITTISLIAVTITIATTLMVITITIAIKDIKNNCYLLLLTITSLLTIEMN
jgi:hypothetical protein